jgi:hypothetical protein
MAADTNSSKGSRGAGYLYVLVHPSDPELYKIGVTILHPEKRLAQHNRDHKKYVGQIVKETGQKWEIRHILPYLIRIWQKEFFGQQRLWRTLPYLGGIEVQKMEWQWVEMGLNAAKKAGCGRHRGHPRHCPTTFMRIRHG